MAVGGLQNLLIPIATILQTNWSITTPAKTVSTVRISGSNDPTYGSVGWLPPLDDSPFCLMWWSAVKDDQMKQPQRVWANYQLHLFLGVTHVDTPASLFDYNLQALEWVESARQLVANHIFLVPESSILWPTSGDVRWIMTEGEIINDHAILGAHWYGVHIVTQVIIVTTVQYQFFN